MKILEVLEVEKVKSQFELENDQTEEVLDACACLCGAASGHGGGGGGGGTPVPSL